VILKKGKKNLAEKICYGSLDIIKKKTGNDPLKVFKTAIDNVKPSIEVKSRRVGGASYQVPVDIRPARRLALAFRWIISYARKGERSRWRKSWQQRYLMSFNNLGSAVKKREDTHKMAEANKAFAHYRW